jgi:hypothetical protein
MHSSLALERPSPTFGVFGRMRPEQRPRAVGSSACNASDADLLRLQAAFGPTGGVASGDEVARLMRFHSEQPISLLARWIVKREVLSFVWRSQTLMPLFQFERGHAAVRSSVRGLIEELSVAFDDLELVTWFAQPSSWLAGATPADILEHDLPAVRQAARADRFVAIG